MSIIDKAMKIALQLAKESLEVGNGPFGAVVIMGNQIIGQSRNTTKDDFDPTAHAEIKAIRNACLNLQQTKISGATLVTSCYPCSMCQSALYWAGIEKVHYAVTNEDTIPSGYDDSWIYKELTLDDDQKKATFNQTMTKEGLSILKLSS